MPLPHRFCWVFQTNWIVFFLFSFIGIPACLFFLSKGTPTGLSGCFKLILHWQKLKNNKTPGAWKLYRPRPLDVWGLGVSFVIVFTDVMPLIGQINAPASSQGRVLVRQWLKFMTCRNPLTKEVFRNTCTKWYNEKKSTYCANPSINIHIFAH